MHAHSGQLQGIFGFLRPLIHVRILVWSWSVDKNDGVPLQIVIAILTYWVKQPVCQVTYFFKETQLRMELQ